MLVPKNIANPKSMLCFGPVKINYCECTNLLKDFYEKPE